MGGTLGYSPPFQSTIGFDRLVNLLDSTAFLEDASQGYRPNDVQKVDDSTYRVSIAVAGFSEDDLSVANRDNTLIVPGKRRDNEDGARQFLRRAIAGLCFRRTFRVADNMKAVGAHLENGLPHSDLVRDGPKEMKSRKIEILAATPAGSVSNAKRYVGHKPKAA